jgi:hypothetical protein
MQELLERCKGRLGRALLRLGLALLPPAEDPLAEAPQAEAPQSLPVPQHSSEPLAAAQCPGLREPLSVESAVLGRDMTVLKREASDALAALGAAHALVASARLAQVQDLRSRFESGEVTQDVMVALAGDYQGWQNDQVRLFDALSLVLGMKVPPGKVLDVVDPGLHPQARNHLEALSAEYQRGVLNEQFRRQS